MDVTLITTHRCNLACEYCYAGEHYRREMDDATMEKALDLLYVDGANISQLSFFGGEPFLAFERMAKAIQGAKERAEFLGRRLVLQCTTNGTLIGKKQLDLIVHHGMKITVSLDGIQEAHDLTRRRAGGGSSFDAVYAGLRSLLDAQVSPSVLMVVTPQTAPFFFRSVRWLWEEGVEDVRVNLSLRDRWSKEDKDLIKKELIAIGRELLYRRLRGENVRIDAIDDAMQKSACGGERGQKRLQVVVATGGNLYPCAPMVGEDRDEGPEATLRIGHIDNGPEAILAGVHHDGAGCGDGEACACAAYLETGDREQSGPNGLWFHRVSVEVSMAVSAGLAKAKQAHEEPVAPSKNRRKLLQSLLLGAAGLAVAGGLVSTLLPKQPTSACSVPQTSSPETKRPMVPGSMPVMTPPGKLMAPAPEPEPEIRVKGELKAPSTMPAPSKEESVKLRGKIAKPKNTAE